MKFWDILNYDIIPRSKVKYVIAFSGAAVGGIVFGMSQSWAAAIFYDLLAVLLVWSVLKLVRAI